tara:strand:- start:1378 stop:1710 length:333 start_codon:yes stop_codon:yes gene_type:complete
MKKSLLKLKIKTLEDIISKNKEIVHPIPFWRQVLDQKVFYNGHGQFIEPELNISDIKTLINSLTDNCGQINDIFYLKLFSEGTGWGGSVYQSLDICEEDKLWLSIENVII